VHVQGASPALRVLFAAALACRQPGAREVPTLSFDTSSESIMLLLTPLAGITRCQSLGPKVNSEMCRAGARALRIPDGEPPAPRSALRNSLPQPRHATYVLLERKGCAAPPTLDIGVSGKVVLSWEQPNRAVRRLFNIRSG
jgi:hypothetical protein